MVIPTRKCVKCGKDATVTFGADPDMRGVPSCDDCKQNVQLALYMAVSSKEDFFKILKKMK